jgi:membrane protein DedA with SNARE-associated domain
MGWIDIGGWLDGLGQLDPAVIYLVIGGLALLESAALVGLFVPGETAVLLGGFLAREGNVNVFVMMLVVAFGATLGDSISYEIGRHAGPWLADSKLGRLLGEQRLDAGTRYLQRRGAKAVFFGRFVAVVRTGVPLLAGVSRMRYRAFLTWNMLGAVIWAIVHVSAGYAAGASRDRLESIMHSAGFIGIGVIAVVVLVHVSGGARLRRTLPGTNQT